MRLLRTLCNAAYDAIKTDTQNATYAGVDSLQAAVRKGILWPEANYQATDRAVIDSTSRGIHTITRSELLTIVNELRDV